MTQFWQKGYSLLELALVIAAAGMAVTVGAAIFQQRAEENRSVSHAALVAGADQAIAGFIYSHSRLPCPAATQRSGAEDCSLSTGWFPFRTVGMARPPENSAGHPLRYAHYSRPHANGSRDAALGTLRDRFRPYFALDLPPVGSAQTMGTENGLDLCQALVIADNLSPSQTLLNVVQPNDDFTNVAYVLVNPGIGDADGNGQVLDGVNAQLSDAAPIVASPDTAPGSSYDDRVHAVHFNQLSQALDCANVMAPTNAHANALTAATVMNQVILDYEEQLDMMEFLSEADLVTGAGDLLSASVDAAAVTAESATSVASSINSFGSLAAALAASAVAVGLAAAALTVSIAGQVTAAETNDAIGDEIDAFASQRGEIVSQQQKIHNHLIQIDAGGLYD